MSTPVPMIATCRQTYNGRALKADDKFDAVDELDAADLVAIRHAVRDKKKAALLTKPEPTPPAVEVRTASMQAKSEEEDESVAPASTLDGKQSYSRRDMRAKR